MLKQIAVLSVLFAQVYGVRVCPSPEEGPRLDPEVYMDATKLITSKGYPCENHWVTTKDGYILNLVRIPHGRNNSIKDTRPVVFLQHGIFSSCTNFIINLANESLAFILADAGADVWLGNSRGNIYSRNHTTLSPKDLKFWEFGWDEMGQYDVPANVNYIRKATGQDKISYVGHSQGTAIAFAEFSENQELASHIKHFVAMAPVARTANVKGPMKMLPNIQNEVNEFFELFNHGAITMSQAEKDYLAIDICPKVKDLCLDLMFLVTGYDLKTINMTRLPVYFAHNPAGISSRTLLQWSQNVQAKQFQKFDYGSAEKNMQHYGQSTPPIYDPRKMKIPVSMFSGGQDRLADPTDVAWLLTQVNVTLHVNIDYYNHIDFILAMDAPEKIYKDIVNIVMS